MKYTTKPFEIEALQYTGDNKDQIEVFADGLAEINTDTGDYEVWDYLQQTWVIVNPYDYVIRGMKGEFYPCDAEVFEAKYEPSGE